MSESSYEKVYKRIAATRQCKALLAGLSDQIEAIHVQDVEFTLHRPDELGKPADAIPVFKVSTPGGPSSTTNGQVYLELGNVLGERKLKPLIDEVFGVVGGVPTYFCRKSVVDGSEYRKGTISFSSWLVRRIGSQHSDVIEQARARVLEEVRDWQSSELVARKQREFLVKCAVEDIKKALSSFSFLGKDVLKAAIDEFVVHEICDS